MLRLICFFALAVSFSDCTKAQRLIPQKKVIKLMGCGFELTAIAKTDTLAWEAINAGINEISRIEKLISSWDKNSQTSAINRAAGLEAVIVEKELFDLIYRAKKISKLTQGAFDISFASMDKIWKFDGSMKRMPSDKFVKAAAAKINWENIILNKDNHSVFLKEKGMKIGFGAIGKGYAANRALSIMKQMPIQGALVNASGDLISWGSNSKGNKWSVQIADPKDKNKSLAWLELKNMAVVTSGDYERFVKFDGKRYAHIIDPRTGYPTTGIKSVTVVCPDAEVADALATSVFVLGITKGLSLVNGLNGVECLIITDEDELLSSTNLNLNYY